MITLGKRDLDIRTPIILDEHQSLIKQVSNINLALSNIGTLKWSEKGEDRKSAVQKAISKFKDIIKEANEGI